MEKSKVDRLEHWNVGTV